MADPGPDELRVLVLAPTGRDGALACSVLAGAGVPVHRCRDMAELCLQGPQSGCLLVAEEALTPQARGPLRELLHGQPPWSDLPLLVLTRRGADSATAAMALSDFSNVTLVERPVRIGALVSCVRTAQRARQRQYEIRAHLEAEHDRQLTLREADRRKDEFLATLAHELRNPLAPIRNSLHLLRLGGGSQEMVDRVRGVMERQVDQMVRLVDDLMEVSRITRGKIALRRQRMDLLQVLRSAVEAGEPQIDEAGHQLVLDLPQAPLPVDGDEVRLVQVFGNLLNNAARYTEAPGCIWLSARAEDGQAVVTVRDTGIGIARSDLPRVFGMFYQAAGPHRRAGGGLGIGLTLVHSLVELHGGEVAVHSDGPGTGCTFTVRLPLVDTLAPRARRGATAAPPPLRVLVVDDNVDAADSLGAVLECFGATVEVVHDGAGALGAVPRFCPDLVLLDLGMPDMDGYEVARQLRADPALAGLSLVALTGWGQPADRCRSREAGFDEHVTKPTDMDTLHALLERVGRRQAGAGASAS